eukprot:TRINITY_DN4473_c0_g1_i3.p1 TRINITY_DN4473_c0_g1~~TRINITY_DN4473_c0_g1_i3.p1  ORF type:complete len:228 (-),score=5.55 TRINITY_DN4473_c0_g1_i3:401-1084(-)
MAMMAATISPAVVCSTASLTVVRSRAARSPSSFFGASTAGSFRHSSVQAIPVVSFAPRQTDSRRGSSRVVCGLFGLGLPELLVVGGVALVLFGPKQLPEVGKGLGRTVKGFQEVSFLSLISDALGIYLLSRDAFLLVITQGGCLGTEGAERVRKRGRHNVNGALKMVAVDATTISSFLCFCGVTRKCEQSNFACRCLLHASYHPFLFSHLEPSTCFRSFLSMRFIQK